MELLIKNARLRNREDLVHLGIDQGKIVLFESALKSEALLPEAGEIIDASGRLTVPGLIDPHIHLDKALIAEVVRPNVSGTLKEAIEIIWEKKKHYTVEDTMDRVTKVARMALKNGTTRMRTHVDIDTIGKLKPLEGVLAAREAIKGWMDLQIVAFPQEGIVRDPGCKALMEEAMRLGCDLVGGMPANEASPADSLEHVRFCFELAQKYNADIDMHVDETDDPFYRTLEMVADETLRTGFQGRVTAGHTCALASYDDHYAAYVIEKVRRAQLHMITNPVTNLMLQGRQDGYPKRRGLTRVKELIQAGVNVGYGQDCVKDTFYPLGRADLLEVGNILAHAAQMSLPGELRQVFDMPLENAAKILGLKGYGLEVGNIADVLILDAQTPAEALRMQPDRLYVIKSGKVLSRTWTQTEMAF